jgi:hypothetical protein
MKLYTTLIRPVVPHAAETWTLNISDENVLRILERKDIRKIYGLFVKTTSGGLDPTWKLIVYSNERTQ